VVVCAFDTAWRAGHDGGGEAGGLGGQRNCAATAGRAANGCGAASASATAGSAAADWAAAAETPDGADGVVTVKGGAAARQLDS